ncbi:hypothetical protein [Jiangella alkaliphila]|nr:hypothetical protein [Jiangella alkaliphila]
MSINNRDGQFSPRNPVGPLYGKIARNSRIRVTVTTPDTTERIRFTGEVAAWPQEWDTTGTDVWVPIEASGVTRRLGAGNEVQLSSFRQFMIDAQSSLPDNYWPLDAESGITRSFNVTSDGVIGVKPFAPAGLGYVRFGEGDLAPLPNGAEIGGSPSGYSATCTVGIDNTQIAMDFVFKSEKLGRLRISIGKSTGASTRWSILLRGNTNDNDVGLALGIDVNPFAHSGVLPELSDGTVHHVRMVLFQDGSDVDYTVYVDGVSRLSGTRSSEVLPDTGDVKVDYDQDEMDYGGAPLALGHFCVFVFATEPDIDETMLAFRQYAGETAGRRMERLCGEHGLTFSAVGDLDATVVMGPQGAGGLTAALIDAATADGGLLFEPADALGYAYRTREDLYNQAAALELDYSDGVLSEVPTAIEDDSFTLNDVTASSPGGGSARAVLESGPMSVQDPPDGVSRYQGSISRNVLSDGTLADQAGWALHLGTIDEPRFPAIALNLARPLIAGDDALTAAIAELGFGDLVSLVNLPVWVPGDALQLVLGYAELLSNFEWQVRVNGRPGSAFTVADTDVDRYDAIASALASGVNSTATTLSVADDWDAGVSLWSTDDAVVPFDIGIGGEQMTVSDISGTTSPQTFTVTRSVNGVVKSHATGAKVQLWKTPRYAL